MEQDAALQPRREEDGCAAARPIGGVLQIEQHGPQVLAAVNRLLGPAGRGERRRRLPAARVGYGKAVPVAHVAERVEILGWGVRHAGPERNLRAYQILPACSAAYWTRASS